MMKFIMFRGNSQAASLIILHFNENIEGQGRYATKGAFRQSRAHPYVLVGYGLALCANHEPRQIRRGSAFSTRSTCSTRL
jgi:hypothetical protein